MPLRIRLPITLLLLLPVIAAITGVCKGQSPEVPRADGSTEWKQIQLIELSRKLDGAEEESVLRAELASRKKWLEGWTEGSLVATDPKNPGLRKPRPEPILDPTGRANGLRANLMGQDATPGELDILALERATSAQPDDIGLQQLSLHWIDSPSRRKSNLEEIELATVRLIRMLKSTNAKTPKIQLAIEHTMYRRGRALAYRELPVVVEQHPIEDPKKLDEEIHSAYNALIEETGTGRSEFILLEIRMHRRAKRFGCALDLLEQYGSSIKPQWYMKKRRDLLKELQWDPPYSEAARIYAAEFPAEVAKEQLRVPDSKKAR